MYNFFIIFVAYYMSNRVNHRPMSPAMKMADLMNVDFSLVGVSARMGLGLGFGEATVEEVCAECGVDPQTFLLLCRVHLSEGYRPSREALQNANLHDILSYLKQSHNYYTGNMLPSLEAALEEMVLPCEESQKQVIRQFFAQYRQELLAHFSYEEQTVFPYVEKMLDAPAPVQFTIGEYEQNHTNVEEKLADLKNLVMMYMPSACNQQDAYKALFYLYNLERDLARHTLIEDQILVPMVVRMEEVVAAARPEGEELTQREKEILVSVAKGLLNKEIADQYNISIYTVITHRKNITRKTGIKTVAGLTVYALLNHLIDPSAL